jgi:hypothetical protein
MQKSLTTDGTDGTDNTESRRRTIDRNTSPFGNLLFVFASTIFLLKTIREISVIRGSIAFFRIRPITKSFWTIGEAGGTGVPPGERGRRHPARPGVSSLYCGRTSTKPKTPPPREVVPVAGRSPAGAVSGFFPRGAPDLLPGGIATGSGRSPLPSPHTTSSPNGICSLMRTVFTISTSPQTTGPLRWSADG